MIDQLNALKPRNSPGKLLHSQSRFPNHELAVCPVKPIRSKGVEQSQDPRAEPEVSPKPDPVDYNHTVLPASPGISRRPPKLVIPTLHRQLSSFPTFDHHPSSVDSQPKSQPHSLSPPSQANISPFLPHTPLEQIAHTPLLPPEIPRFLRVKPHLRVAHQPTFECNTPILFPSIPQDPVSPLFHPLDTLRPPNASANPRPLLRPRQLSYFHSVPTRSDSSPRVSDVSSTVPRTESLASPLVLFQPALPSNPKIIP